MSKQFIATPEIDVENITYYAEGSTPEIAYKKLCQSGDLTEYIELKNLQDEAEIDIAIMSQIKEGDDNWNEDEAWEGWTWMSGGIVDIVKHQLYKKGS